MVCEPPPQQPGDFVGGLGFVDVEQLSAKPHSSRSQEL